MTQVILDLFICFFSSNLAFFLMNFVFELDKINWLNINMESSIHNSLYCLFFELLIWWHVQPFLVSSYSFSQWCYNYLGEFFLVVRRYPRWNESESRMCFSFISSRVWYWHLNFLWLIIASLIFALFTINVFF